MPFNGSGVFQRVRNWVADATAGIKIRADYHDAEDDGFAEGLTNCITKDGQTIVTQNIPWNSKRITGLQDPVNPQDASTKAYTDTKMPLAGGVMTGDLYITKDAPQIALNDTDANIMAIQAQRNGVLRWWLRLGNGEVETGANAGSNFDLHHYADDGTYLGQVLKFNRSTGLGTIKVDYPIAPEGIANKNYVDTRDAALQAAMQPALGFTPVQQGGAPSMGANKVYIGWQDGIGLIAHVDATPLGAFAFGSVIKNARLAYAGDVAQQTGPQSSPYEPYAGGALTGWQWALITGIPMVTAFRIRYMQLYTTSWFTIGYA